MKSNQKLVLICVGFFIVGLVALYTKNREGVSSQKEIQRSRIESHSEPLRLPQSVSTTPSAHIETQDKIEKEESANGDRAKIRFFLKLITDEIVQSTKKGKPLNRQGIAAAGSKDPLSFAKAAAQILENVPFEQVEMHELILSLLIDVSAKTNNPSDEVFEELYAIADRELKQDELLEVPDIEQLDEYQKHVLFHAGYMVQKGNNFYRSTLGPKVVTIELIKTDLNLARKKKYLDEIEQKKLGKIDPFTVETIRVLINQK